MAQGKAAMTKIEWVRSPDGSEGMSWNALRAVRWVPDPKGPGMKKVSANHCEHVNDACRFCYAERMNARHGGLPFKPGHRKDYTFEIDERKLLEPLRRRKPTRIFVESMSDAFGEWWPDEFIDKLYAVMALCPQHTFINLSKRPERRRRYLDDPEFDNRLNGAIWSILGTPAGSEIVHHGKWRAVPPEADEFLPPLLRTKAALFALSAEPLLGPIDLTNVAPPDTGYGGKAAGINAISKFNRLIRGVLDLVITGGESGPKARPMHPGWATSIRDQCAAAGVAYFHKQNGMWVPHRPVAGGDLGGDCRADRVRIVHLAEHTFAELCQRSFFRGDIWMQRVKSKGAAGRLLDGVEHNEFPQTGGPA
jgi:protein gp37